MSSRLTKMHEELQHDQEWQSKFKKNDRLDIDADRQAEAKTR